MVRHPVQQSLSTEVRTEDVLAALSAFPTPPSHIPPSPVVSNDSSSYFALAHNRDGAAPTSSFSRSKTKTKGGAVAGLSRSDSGQSVGSTSSRQVRPRGGYMGQEGEKRDSAGSGSSTSSGLVVNGRSGILPSQMSGRPYFTAPNSSLPPAAAAAVGQGLGVGTRPSASSSLNATPSSAYPPSTSPGSAHPPSATSSTTSSGRHGRPDAYPPLSSTGTRTGKSMLTTPVSTSASSLASSSQHSTSTVGMSPIQERDEREHERERPRLPPSSRRQSSLPPSSHRRQRAGLGKTESGSGSEIGGPPTVPLPPLPSTAKSASSSSFGEATPTRTPGHASNSATPKEPPSAESLPSMRARGKRVGSLAQEPRRRGRDTSIPRGVSRRDAGICVADGEVLLPELPKNRPKPNRAGTMPLRIDIPPTLSQELEREYLEQIDKPLRTGSSANSLLLREFDERSRREREQAVDNDKSQSPTTSLFSVASGATTRSGIATAQSLRDRISGLLEGLESIPGTPNIVANMSSRTTPSPAAGTSVGGGEEERMQRLQKKTGPALHLESSSEKIAGSGLAAGTASDGLGEPSSSSSWSLKMSSTTRTPSTVREGKVPPLTVPSPVRVPAPSDAETIGGPDAEPGASSDVLLSQFPPTLSAPQPPPSFAFPDSNSKSSSSLLIPPSAAGSPGANGILRTLSQSRRKPLPSAPGHHSSLSSINTCESSLDRKSSSMADGAVDAIRGRKSDARRDNRDGASSPDIATIICSTRRPVSRSKSLSARSSRWSKSLSARSSSIRSSNRVSAMPSLPSERDKQAALARFSALSSLSSTSLSHMSSIKQNGLSTRRSAGSDFAEAYGGAEDDGDATADYGVAIARHRGGYDLSPPLPDGDERLDNSTDEFGVLQNGKDAGEFYTAVAEAGLGGVDNGSPVEEESDSDIDIHTPLPHILLREGVLSSHSKVLAAIRTSFVGTGRESVASYATNASFGSVMTKSGLFKDERHTEKRRRRHRDGKLLREGLGLTTGLGWSDSEDEDAPSPFTNRVSKMTLSRNASIVSVHSASSKKSQFFSRSTPTSQFSSSRPSLPTSLPSHGPKHRSEQHSLSKSQSSASLPRPHMDANPKLPSMKGNGEDSTTMSPTLTNSSTTSLPFPPTPRDDTRDDVDDIRPHAPSDLRRSTSRASSIRAKTPTGGSLKSKQSISSLRTRTSSMKSTPPSRLPSTTPPTPRPLRLPALQRQKLSIMDTQDNSRLQPGQPAPGFPSLLGYNRNLHDKQRAQYLAAPKSAPSTGNLRDSSSTVPSRAFAQSVPSSSSSYNGTRAYDAMPLSLSLHPSSGVGASASRLREPSPSRASAPMPGRGRPRTGTGMMYHQTSMPSRPIGAAI